MVRPGLSRFWPVIAVALALMVVLGLPLFWSFFNRAPELEITPDPGPPYSGNIYINGDVSNPGIYPFGPGDTLADLVPAGGGRISLHHIPRAAPAPAPGYPVGWAAVKYCCPFCSCRSWLPRW